MPADNSYTKRSLQVQGKTREGRAGMCIKFEIFDNLENVNN
jgi:hypothetical protein